MTMPDDATTGSTTGDSAKNLVDCMGCDEMIEEGDRGCTECLDFYGVGMMEAAAQDGNYVMAITSGATIEFERVGLAGDWAYLHEVVVSGTVELAQIQIAVSQIVFMGEYADGDEEEKPDPEPEPEPAPDKEADPPWASWMGAAKGLPQPADLVAPKRGAAA